MKFTASRMALSATLILALSLPLRGETVAVWLFDEPVKSSRTAALRDATGHGFDLELGDGQIVVDGKFGNGLLCPARASDFVARRKGVQGSGLNLGNRDWTIEWWQRRDAPVARGHVDWVYLLAEDNVDRNAAQKSWELGFQTELRFCGPGVWCHDQSNAWADKPLFLNVFADKYDEVNRIALVRDVNLDFYNGTDRSFHHIAWVYDAHIKRLMYFEDGQGPFYVRDGTFDTPGNQGHSVYGIMGNGPLDKYPWKYDVYNGGSNTSLYIGGENVIGADDKSGIGITKIPESYRFTPRPRAEQTAKGVIDEMRVSDVALYHKPFTPPASFAASRAGPWITLSDRRLDFRSVADGAAPAAQTITLRNTGSGEVQWKAKSLASWLTVAPAAGRLGDAPVQVTVAVDSKALWSSIHKAQISFTSGPSQPAQVVEVQYAIQPADSVVWLFDEPVDSPSRFQLEDQSINGYDLLLGPGGKIVPGGRFGNALDPRSPRPGQAATRRYIDPGHLNLGDFDWTWECWLQPLEPASEGDVLFTERENIRIGPWPYYTGVGSATALDFGPGATLRFVNERSGLKGQSLQTEPALVRGDGKWHHVALAYAAASRQLIHWVDGVRRDSVVLPAPLLPFEPTGENSLSIGKTIEGHKPFKGLIDEMRFTAGLRYGGDRFEPPASLARPREPMALAAGPHLFLDDYLIARSENLQRVQHAPEYPVDKPEGWDEYMQVVGASDIVDDGPGCADPKRRFKRISYFHSLAESTDVGGYTLYYAPTMKGPWVSHETNPFLHYTWAGQPGSMVGGSDVLSILFDPILRKYLIYHKTYPLSGENPELSWYRDERYNYHNRVISGQRRLPSLMTSDDAIHWTTPQRIINVDDWDTGEAQAQIHMVYRRGDLLLGHLCMHNDEIDRATMYTVLSASRDGYHWTRWREPFIPYGEEPTRGDKVIVPQGNDQLFMKGDYMYLGISAQGSHKPPRRSWSGCARLPIDRFVSRAARGERPGRLTTPLLSVDRKLTQMQINAQPQNIVKGGSAEPAYIRVQACDRRGVAIPGFAFEDCAPITGDSLRHPVRWKNGSIADLAALGQPLQFEFEVRNADLYAFYLTGPGWTGDHDFIAETDPGRDDLTDPYELLGIERPNPTKPTDISVTPTSLTFELTKLPGLSYSGNAPEQTITVKPRDPNAECTITETIPWLVIRSEGKKNDDGSTTYTVRATGGALDTAVYLGKIAIRADGVAGGSVDIPVTFNLK